MLILPETQFPTGSRFPSCRADRRNWAKIWCCTAAAPSPILSMHEALEGNGSQFHRRPIHARGQVYRPRLARQSYVISITLISATNDYENYSCFRSYRASKPRLMREQNNLLSSRGDVGHFYLLGCTKFACMRARRRAVYYETNVGIIVDWPFHKRQCLQVLTCALDCAAWHASGTMKETAMNFLIWEQV